MELTINLQMKMEVPTSEEELLATIQMLRDANRVMPNVRYSLQVYAPELTSEQMRDILARVQPPFDNVDVLAQQMVVGAPPSFGIN